MKRRVRYEKILPSAMDPSVSSVESLCTNRSITLRDYSQRLRACVRATAIGAFVRRTLSHHALIEQRDSVGRDHQHRLRTWREPGNDECGLPIAHQGRRG